MSAAKVENKAPVVVLGRCFTEKLESEALMPHFKVEGGLNTNFNISDPVDIPLEDDWHVLALTFDVKVVASDSRPVFSVKITQAMLYQAVGLSPEDFRNLVHTVIPNHIIPYLGAKLSMTVADMGYPPLVLPVITFGPPKPEAKPANKSYASGRGAPANPIKLH